MTGLEILGDSEAGAGVIALAALVYYLRAALHELTRTRQSIERLLGPRDE